MARALRFDLPADRARCWPPGRSANDVAEIVVSETRHLDRRQRRQVDKQIVDGRARRAVPGRGRSWPRSHAYEIDPPPTCAGAAPPGSDRRVGLRPAPDTMSVLTAFLPVEQGVACLAALRAHTDTVIGTGDGRSRDQIMADTLVERVTGQTTAADVNVEVGIVIPVDALARPRPAAAPPRSSGTGRSRPGSPATCSPAPRASAGGGGCSPPTRQRAR